MTDKFPPAPATKIGWPWPEDSGPMPPLALNGKPWPKISIVTPSYNQGQFIEETIRSVLLQGYPNLEYIIIDGGSSDNSVDIIKKYEPWLSYWVSEPDKGQSHAINKGFKLATGEIYAWINSDDYYLHGAFAVVGEAFTGLQEKAILLGYGDVVDVEGAFLDTRKIQRIDREILLNWEENWFLQQACFWPSTCWNAVEGVNEGLELLMDYDLWFRFLKICPFFYIDQPLGVLRYYENTKSFRERGRSFAEKVAVWVLNGRIDAAVREVENCVREKHNLQQELARLERKLTLRIMRKLGLF
ncbi:MAG TPA: glycosyltransferase family 2 protein [Syntrophales bacterium]|nr:glycosyltransferase family 2 protein [Syntrophales bacterium]